MLKTLILLKTSEILQKLSYTRVSPKPASTIFVRQRFFTSHLEILHFFAVQLYSYWGRSHTFWADATSVFLRLLVVLVVLRLWPADCYAELCLSPFFRKAGETILSIFGAIGRVAIRFWTFPLTFCDARRWDLYEFFYMFSSFRVRRAVFLIVFWFNLLPLAVTALLLESVPYTAPLLDLLSNVGFSHYQLNKTYESCFEVFKWLSIIYGIIFVGTAFSNQNTDQQAELRRWALKEPSDWGKFVRFVRKVWKWCRGK
jgi:hypothetical protein